MNSHSNSRASHNLTNFSQMLLDWDYESPGRGLPWAFSNDPYRVWVSEIMLQQTQAQTVVSYFNRFIEAFPDVTSLANASTDDVMALWAGLGYYTRARNLHSTAKIIRDQHQGEFPQTFEEVLALPGIGKSTAGAICALAFGLRTPILDGNAKRVYARFHCVKDPSESVRSRQLWQHANEHTPEHQTQRFTQLIMDLGALVCTPKSPSCSICPVGSSCCARINNLVDQLPLKKSSKSRKVKETTMLIITDDSMRVLLHRRPPKGIWGGLWSFPECNGDSNNIESRFYNQYRMRIQTTSSWNQLTHDFTHFRLMITPQPAKLISYDTTAFKEQNYFLFEYSEALSIGIPVPVRTILTVLAEQIPGLQ